MRTLDLNCDLGEGAGHDAELMPLVTSASIACGAHAGDEATMRATVALAQRHGVAIGAHPGFADRANFGRKEMRLSADALRRLVIEQVAALARLAPLRHVKPHGALYTLAARDRGVADTLAEAVASIGTDFVLFALAGSELVRSGRRCGLRVAEEAFADRTYRRDGTLTPRGEPGALIADEAAAVAQVLSLARDGVVRAADDTEVLLKADTICLHGDGPHAVAFARRLRSELAAAGIRLQAVST